MARRRPTRADFDRLVKDQRERGFEHYCTPQSWDRGICPSHGNTDPHVKNSRHRLGLALDFGWPGPPVSNAERLHVLLEMRRLANDPNIEWRMLFNLADNDHPDHGHLDDRPDWGSRVLDRQGILARDGYDLFASVRAFPDHRPPVNRGYTLSHIATFQTLAQQLDLYPGRVDGYYGTNTANAAREVQKRAGITVDGLPGTQTLAAVRRLIDGPPAPEPEPVIPVDRVAGVNRYGTGRALIERFVQKPHKVYLAAAGTDDVSTAAGLGDGPVLLGAYGSQGLPGETRRALTALQPRELIVVGGENAIPRSQAEDAYRAAGLVREK